MSHELQLLKHQLAFMQSDRRFVCLTGGFGCGKSFAIGAKLWNLARVNAGFDGMLVSRSATQLRKLRTEVETVFNATGTKWIAKGFDEYHLKFGGATSVIYLGTTENDAYKRWAGGNLAYVVIDEIDTMPKAEDIWRFANYRVRVRAPLLQSACASTPEGFGFLWDFFDNQVRKDPSLVSDRELIKGCTFDNPYIDPAYVRGQIQTRDPRTLRAYVYGEFVNLEGNLVYWKFDRELNKTTFTLADFPNHVLHIGVDFNKGINATTVAVVKNNQLYFVDEIYGAQDTQALANEIKKRYPWHTANNALRFYCDASGFEGINNLKRNFNEYAPDGNHNFRHGAANPRIERRVAAFNEKLRPVGRSPELFVNITRCPELVNGMSRQTYDGSGAPDKNSGLDHSVDAAGYLVWKLFPVSGQVRATIG